MVFAVSKRSVKGVMYLTSLVILIYMSLNIAYMVFVPWVFTFGKSTDSALRAAVDGGRGGASYVHEAINLRRNAHELLRLRDIQVQNDGTVDLRMNLDMLGMVRLMSALADGSFMGEMTANPLPINVSFIIDSVHICENIPNLNFLIYVHTAAKNVARRKIIRSTWARKGLFKADATRLVFLMGKPSDDEERAIIDKESKAFKDLVVGDFIDHYRNLTLKAIMGLKWTSLYCRNAKYVIKADDDAFVNIFALQKILKLNEHRKRLVACPLWKENTMPILRDPSKCMKWCVKFTEFPGKTHFPKYCAGLAFVMSQEIIPPLYHAAQTTPFFWIDDVYISGVVAPKVKGIEYVDLLRNFTLKEKLASEQYLDNSKKELTYYFAHVKTTSTFHKMWNATLLRLNDAELSSISEEVIDEYPVLKSRRKLLR